MGLGAMFTNSAILGAPHCRKVNTVMWKMTHRLMIVDDLFGMNGNAIKMLGNSHLIIFMKEFPCLLTSLSRSSWKTLLYSPWKTCWVIMNPCVKHIHLSELQGHLRMMLDTPSFHGYTFLRYMNAPTTSNNHPPRDSTFT